MTLFTRRSFLGIAAALGVPGLAVAAPRPPHLASLERFRAYLLPGCWGFHQQYPGVLAELIVRHNTLELSLYNAAKTRQRIVTICSARELSGPYPVLTAVERMRNEFESMAPRS